MKELCYLNGRVVPIAEARIDPRDRGLTYGDSLYEVVHVESGVILHLEHHLERLAGGLAKVSIPFPDGLEAAFHELAAAACADDVGYLYLQVTRGSAQRANFPPAGLAPTVLILPVPYRYSPPAGRLMRAASVPDMRWGHCDVKTTSMMATVLAKQQAAATGADEVLFAGPDGELREGGSCNLMVRRADRLETHPLDSRVLPGVTRKLLLEYAREEGFEIVERPPRAGELGEWQEALLCGTLTGVQPLVALDGREVAGGRPGAWTRLLAERLAADEAVMLRGSRAGAGGRGRS